MNNIDDFFCAESPLQRIITEETKKKGIHLFMKRDDLLHPGISGNKWRKLKYNIAALLKSEKKGIITFGGAYSNHLHAVAVSSKVFNFSSAGIVRGERPDILSPTLLSCLDLGMKLHFVSRNSYREKENAPDVQNLLSWYQDFLLLPEGGENEAAKKGCVEILEEINIVPDYVCVPCGTGTTLAGMMAFKHWNAHFIGFPVLKSAESSIRQNVNSSSVSYLNRYTLLSDYHFGGYAKQTCELLDFIRKFEGQTGVLLEQVYTGKMMFGIIDLITKGFFKKGSKIVAIHTGGIQGRLPELG